MGFSNPPIGEASEPSAACMLHAGVPATRACDDCSRPYCERCLVSLNGRTVCGACKHASLSRRFQVQMVAAPVAGGPMPQAAPPGSVCALHADAVALAICERCGDFMCHLCTTPYEGRFYCLRCFELQWQRGQLAVGGGKTYHLPGLALALAITALTLSCLPVVNFLFAVPSVVLGAVAWRRTVADPTLPGNGAAVAAMVLGGMALLVAAAATAFLPS
jgi:hypothetical protein